MSQGKGVRRNRGHQYNKNKINVGDTGMEVLENIDEKNPIVQQFRLYSKELDSKHDRFERIVKFSRDILIESKRIIFLLHTLDKESKRDAILSEAELRLDKMEKSLFKNIAYELDGQDPYQYLKAYRASVEEYVEAVTLFYYLRDGSVHDWTNLEKSLTYPSLNKSQTESESGFLLTKTVQTLVTPNEYILGIADLTGELMRKCINNLAAGDLTRCYETCNFVRHMYKGFLSFNILSNREMNRKLYTLKQSLNKMEIVCYTTKVRGSEIPKHMLVDAAIVATEDYTADDDEGYQVY